MMTYLGVNPYGEHCFRITLDKGGDPLRGREMVAWCIENFGPPGSIVKKNRFTAAKARRKSQYWYFDQDYGDSSIGLFFFKRESDGFSFKMRWA